MEDKKYIQPLIVVVELCKCDIITTSVVGWEDDGDNIYDYGDIFG